MSRLHYIDFAHRDDLDLAEKIVREGWSELRRRMPGAREYMLARQGRFEGSNARRKAANQRAADARRNREKVAYEAQVNGRQLSEMEMRALDDEDALALQSERAADREGSLDSSALAGARHVFYGSVQTLVKLHVSGRRYREKKVKIARDPVERLRVILAADAEKRREIERVRNAETPIPTLKQQLVRQLDEALSRDAFNFYVHEGELVRKPPVVSLPAVHAEPARVVTTVDYLPLLVAILGDEIREHYLARIDAAFAGDAALRIDAEEKKTRLTKLRAELLELHYEEAALRVVLAGDSPEIEFRPEMSPLAVLGIEVI
ncbi:hypothetical protein [Devosia sp. Root105]|uniref:hypothetical protein n=1 Tax=Devosia sp. Root105 TaxID=1736423 RepID=UPI0006F51FE4|nr:hypothetical protein [Devosia sp. Root105]KQU95200.1 hypothetical protein ASC68_18790 [Devosia sp. Root105]